jgi:hypothetical protein
MFDTSLTFETGPTDEVSCFPFPVLQRADRNPADGGNEQLTCGTV